MVVLASLLPPLKIGHSRHSGIAPNLTVRFPSMNHGPGFAARCFVSILCLNHDPIAWLRIHESAGTAGACIRNIPAAKYPVAINM